MLSYFNLFDQMHNFSRGMVDTKAVIFYVSLTFFFLFLTLRVSGKPAMEMTNDF